MPPGLLIDSERIYTEVTNTFLASYGKGPLPAEIKAQLMGIFFIIWKLTRRSVWSTCSTSVYLAELGFPSPSRMGSNRLDA